MKSSIESLKLVPFFRGTFKYNSMHALSDLSNQTARLITTYQCGHEFNEFYLETFQILDAELDSIIYPLISI